MKKKLMENEGRLREALEELKMKTLETSVIMEKVNVLEATLNKKEEDIYEQEMKVSGLKELLSTESTVTCSGILLWVSSQLDTTTETIGVAEGRKGGCKENKNVKDLRDIVESLKILRQNETEPLFVFTKHGIRECPTIVPLGGNSKEEPLMARIIAMESLLEKFMNTQNNQNQMINKRFETFDQKYNDS